LADWADNKINEAGNPIAVELDVDESPSGTHSNPLIID
jgi:hypothetical protein